MPALMNDTPRPVDFWFDPICPWTWLTSRWLREVAAQRPLDIRWRVMSLSILNDGRDVPPEYVELLQRAWGPVRLLIAAQEQYGRAVVGDLYNELGERIHRQCRDDDAVIFTESLSAVGLPADLVEAAHSAAWDDALRRSHDEAMALVGDDVGSPVIRLPVLGQESAAYFGPVVNPVPRGADALRLWEGVELLATTPQLHELKRTRGGDPMID